MFKKRGIIVILVLILSIGLVLAGDIVVNNIFVKVSVNGDRLITRSITISSESGGDISLNLLNLKGISVSEQDFYLNPGESKKVNINFNSYDIKDGAHIGSILILSDDQEYILPIIFEVESDGLLFDLDLEIPIQDKEALPGEEILTQIKIFDLVAGGTNQGLGSTALGVKYFVYNLRGDIVTSYSENIILNREVQIDKLIKIPMNISKGDYVMSVVIEHAGLTSVSSELFSVVDYKVEKDFFDKFLDLGFLSILLIILLIFLILWLFFSYFFREKDKIISELKRHHIKEMRHYSKVLKAQEKKIRKRTKSKHKYRRARKEVKEKKRKLKKKYSERVKKMIVLRKEGKDKEMKARLDKWKTQGFKVSANEHKLSDTRDEDMKEIISTGNKRRQKYFGVKDKQLYYKEGWNS